MDCQLCVVFYLSERMAVAGRFRTLHGSHGAPSLRPSLFPLCPRVRPASAAAGRPEPGDPDRAGGAAAQVEPAAGPAEQPARLAHPARGAAAARLNYHRRRRESPLPPALQTLQTPFSAQRPRERPK